MATKTRPKLSPLLPLADHANGISSGTLQTNGNGAHNGNGAQAVSREMAEDFRSSGNLEWIEVNKIWPNPYQPRQTFDEGELDELAASLKEHGVLQPVVLRPAPHDLDQTGYQLVAGERRLRAAKLAGLFAIPAIVRECDDRTLAELALVENAQRADVNVIEQAVAIKRLMSEFAVTVEEVAQRAGISRPAVSNRVRLLDLPLVVQERVIAGALSESHARALVKYAAYPKFVSLYADIVAREGWPSKRLEKGLWFGLNPWDIRHELKDAKVLVELVEPEPRGELTPGEVLEQYPDQVFAQWEDEDGEFDDGVPELWALDVALGEKLNKEWGELADARRSVGAGKTWQQQEKERKEAEQKKAESTFAKAEKTGKLIKCADLPHGSYERLDGVACPPGCNKNCPCRVKAVLFGETVGEICKDPARFKKLVDAKAREEKKKKREAAAAAMAEARNWIDAGLSQPSASEPYKRALVVTLESVLYNNRTQAQKAAERLHIVFDWKTFESYQTKGQKRLEMLSTLPERDLVFLAAEAVLAYDNSQSVDGYNYHAKDKWFARPLDTQAKGATAAAKKAQGGDG